MRLKIYSMGIESSCKHSSLLEMLFAFGDTHKEITKVEKERGLALFYCITLQGF